MNTFRDAQVCISNATRWKLTKLVKAMNGTAPSGLDPTESVDRLAEKVLSEWLTANYPKLDDLHEQRNAIDEQAVSILRDGALRTNATSAPTDVPF